jgi:hypothetical protein
MSAFRRRGNRQEGDLAKALADLDLMVAWIAVASYAI